MDEQTLKGGGFVKLRQKDRWAVRVKVPFGETDARTLHGLAALAERFGDGEMHLTVRQCLEIRGVRLEDFEAVRAALSALGLDPGVCGPRVRVTVTCPGSAVCKRGLNDTRELAGIIDRRLYGREGLPHKFKSAVSGCPSSCAKPQANDVGYVGAVEPVFDEVEGSCIACGLCARTCPTGAITLDADGRPVIDLEMCERDGDCLSVCPTGAVRAGARGWKVYLGGKFGRSPALALEVAPFVSTDEAVAIAERALDAFTRLAQGRERLRDVIDRVGRDTFLQEVL